MEFLNFVIIWTEFRAYSKEIVIQKHKHDFFHFIYVSSGTGSITIGEATYDMLPGKLFAIPPTVEHGFFSIGEEQLETYEIKFHLDPKEAETISAVPFCVNAENTPIKSILTTLYRESHDTLPLSSGVIQLQFRLFMTYLLRICKQLQENTEHAIKTISPEIEKVVHYIHENLTEDISLDTLSDIAGFEKNYFLRKFKKQLHCTPMVYIREKRLEKAKELLSFSDMNITQIAMATGFKSIHYFSKVFYEDMSIRPLDYRNASHNT